MREVNEQDIYYKQIGEQVTSLRSGKEYLDLEWSRNVKFFYFFFWGGRRS